MVAGPDGNGADRESHALRVQRIRAGFRRRPLDDPSSARRGSSGRSADRGLIHALPLAARSYIRGEDALRHATKIRWSRRTESACEEVIKAAMGRELRATSKQILG